MRLHSTACALAIVLGATLGPGAGAAAAGVTTRISVSSDGSEANGLTFNQISLSAGARFVAFSSAASNLVPGDTNECDGTVAPIFSEPGCPDIFVHDRITGATSRVSVDSAGAQANGASLRAVISADGRFVVFDSLASNLVAGDTNGVADIFVHDRQTGATTRVSVSSTGAQSDAVSLSPQVTPDGRFVAFASGASTLVPGDTNSAFDIFVHDRLTATTTRVSLNGAGEQGNADSVIPNISADGRFVAFSSVASNLVAGPASSGTQVYVHDRASGTTTRISVDGGGNPANASSFNSGISADGRFVVFASAASNLVAGDTNGVRDVFVHDRLTTTTTRVNVSSAGAQANGFSTLGFNGEAISADGRFVTFGSSASNLVAGDTNGADDVFLHDRLTGITTRVSVDSAGTQGNDVSGASSLSADGRFVAFISGATNLVPGDDNATFDGFLHDLGGAVDQIADLGALVESFDLHHGTENSLLAKLQAAIDAANAGDTATACAALEAFINQVSAQAGKKITVAEANALIDAATSIRITLGCA
jgi:Tol biopolymer transport system component